MGKTRAQARVGEGCRLADILTICDGNVGRLEAKLHPRLDLLRITDHASCKHNKSFVGEEFHAKRDSGFKLERL